MKKADILNEIKELREKMSNLDDKEYNKINLKIMVKMQEKGYSAGGLTKNPTKQRALDYLEILKNVLEEN